MKAFECPHCGAQMTYDIAKKVMSCEYCGSEILREEYQEYLDKNRLYTTNELVCPQCGTAVLSYDDTIASFCSYCGSPVAFTKRIVEDARPDGIIPFTVTKEEAAEKYRKKLKDTGFAPKWLLEKGGEEKMIGLYIPYYVFGADASGHGKNRGESRTSAGSDTIVREYEMEYDLTAAYRGTRFDAAEAFPDCMSETVDTFDPKKAREFETSYLAGFYADGGNVDEKVYADVVAELVTKDIQGSSFTHDGIKFKTSGISPEIRIRSKKILFPVWLHTYRKGDRISYAAINGQNGDVAAEIPADKGRYLKYSLILAAVFASILNLFLTISPAPFLIVSEIILLAFGLYLRKLTGDVYLRENHLDDLGKIGSAALPSSGSPESPAAAPEKSSPLSFRVPASVRLKGWWKTLVGLAAAVAVAASGTVIDSVIYGVAAFTIALTLWSVFDLLRAQRLLASRDVPIFTMKRGGDTNA
ncbi:MAG: zinc ribbon domain-containing protein [Clostridia bacterium]|nr:zinc ribbon domain-containing protein [Clostridia bacterium]